MVGRFRPHHFDLSLSNAPSWQAACTAFTYLDQPFGYATAPVVALTAHNAQHGVTSNFFDFGGSDDWWSIEDAHLALGYADPGTPLGVTVAYSGAGTAHDPVDSPTSPGQVVFALRDGLVYRRPVPGSHLPGGGYPDFDAAPVVSVSVANADGADDGDLLITPTETVGATRVRHGRLKMLNANGSELLDLALPLELEYFDGVTWTGAVDDLCTVLAIGDFGYLPDDPADVVTGLAAASGSLDYNCSAVAPCALGAIDITADLADAASTGTAAQPWLRYDWDGDGSDEEPRARASFGTYQGSQRHIYVREVF